MSPEEWPSIRSMARCVLPVLVGPSTAVTPAPGARSLENVAWEGEKAICRVIYVLSAPFSARHLRAKRNRRVGKAQRAHLREHARKGGHGARAPLPTLRVRASR